MAINTTVENINNQPTIEPRTVTGIFTKYIAKTLPLAFDESMSYYECLCALLEYLNETIVPDINNTNAGLSELQTFYLQLQEYVNTYFDNLDVQQEINNKLDQMAQDGSLTNLIKDYVDPIYEAYENRINNTVTTQNQTIETQNSNIQTLSSRMDEFSTLTEGSTTGDAELADIRIGYNGQKYVSAGQAVRSVTSALNEETSKYITRTRTKNLFNYLDAIDGYYINSNGDVSPGSGLATSDYIPCEPGDVLIPSTNLTRAYYNSSKELIEYRTNTSTDFSCPAGTAYARYSITASNLRRYVIFKSTGDDDVTPVYDIPYYTYTITGNIPEIKNAYMGYNNQLYFNLANSIQEQVRSLFRESGNYVNRTRTINLFDKDSAIENYYLSNYGRLDSGSEFAVSSFIPCSAGDVLIPSTSLSRCYYDSDKNFIEYRAYNNNDKVCPSNTAYARFTITKSGLNSYVIYKSTGESDVTPKTGIPYYEYSFKGELNNFENETYKIFRKVCCVGDSLTEGYILNSDGETAMVDNNYSWPHYMETSSGNTYYNCGSSGANTKTWLERANGLTKAQNYGHVQAYLIGLGFNDGLPYDGYHLDVGTTSDIGTNNATFYGCMSKIVRELKQISPDAFVFMQTIPSSESRYTDYNTAIKYICNLYKDDYDTHLLDLYEYKDLYTTPLLSGDSAHSHFTAIGYEVCSKNLQYIWSKYLNDNSEDFRDLPDVPIS